jgi:hypothetical protein
MREVAALESAMMPRPTRIVLRTPIRAISAAANGPISPNSTMLIATAREIVDAGQPMSASIGSMSTPGVDRIPAATISTRNVIPTITQP